MNKKLLFFTMSLAALTACTNDDFESQKLTGETCPVKFEVINDAAATRAYMSGDKLIWEASKGDLFTLYHGGLNTGNNAIYKAEVDPTTGNAILSTPTMINPGHAVMVWPVDTTFRHANDGGFMISIPQNQKNIEHNIPYVSDVVNVENYVIPATPTVPAHNSTEADDNRAGYNRTYPVVMRPMASQLKIKADYAGSDAKLAQLYTGADPIDPISVSSITLGTQAGDGQGSNTEFSVKVPVVEAAANINWPAATPALNHNWVNVTDINEAPAGGVVSVNELTASEDCLDGIDGCKFLMLPQNAIGMPAVAAVGAEGLLDATIAVKTRYGKVVIAKNAVLGSSYTAAEYETSWYRYISAASKTNGNYNVNETPAETAGSDGKFKTTSNISIGLGQTINAFGTATAPTGSTVEGERIGVAATRYVVVKLDYLDMSDLHINNDKWLRDAARVWKHMDLDDVTVYLDGTDGEFEISQNTIDVINQINADIIAAGGVKQFHVQPCAVAGEACNTIRVTGGGAIRDLRFIEYNDVDGNGMFNAGDVKADVALKAGETWSWTVDADGNYIVIAPFEGVNSIKNRGTMNFAANATLQTSEDGITSTNENLTAVPAIVSTQNNIRFVNDGTLNVNSGSLNVQVNVTNNGTITIAKGARYIQDGRAQNTVFTNDATNKPSRFTGGNDKKIGKIVNNGVFATVNAAGAAGTTGTINNYGLIEHADVDAKTYITSNQLGGLFRSPFNKNTNKMGRINLPYSNKEEDNISVNAAADQGFISVTVNGDAPTADLNTDAVGALVNYVIINSGIETISKLPATIKYVEINEPGTEIAWTLATKNAAGAIVPGAAAYEGLVVLSPVNIKLNTTITVNQAAYLKADMYVGGHFVWGASGTPAVAATKWNGYYGDTTTNYETMFITY